jgi:hypothetical protein
MSLIDVGAASVSCRAAAWGFQGMHCLQRPALQLARAVALGAQAAACRCREARLGSNGRQDANPAHDFTVHCVWRLMFHAGTGLCCGTQSCFAQCTLLQPLTLDCIIFSCWHLQC